MTYAVFILEVLTVSLVIALAGLSLFEVGGTVVEALRTGQSQPLWRGSSAEQNVDRGGDAKRRELRQ